MCVKNGSSSCSWCEKKNICSISTNCSRQTDGLLGLQGISRKIIRGGNVDVVFLSLSKVHFLHLNKKFMYQDTKTTTNNHTVLKRQSNKILKNFPHDSPGIIPRETDYLGCHTLGRLTLRSMIPWWAWLIGVWYRGELHKNSNNSTKT